MALVAYASSDSGCSDVEDDNEAAISTLSQRQSQSVQVVNKTVPLNDPTATVDHDGLNKPASSDDLTGDSHISDEEDIYPLPASTGGQGLSLPAPKHSAPPENAPDTVTDTVLAEDAGSQSGLLLAGLPQPRAVGTGDGGKVETMVEDELEDIVKPRQEELALQEKPPGRKTRQPVKIVIPALQDREEEDDRGPSRKKMKPAPGKSGLLAFLPPPQQTITKQTNRPLIPHTLSKKPAPTNKPSHTLPRKEPESKKVTSLLPGIEAADDSDDDDDNSSPSFFSFGDSGTEAASVKPRPSVDIVQSVDAIAGPSLRPRGPEPQSGETESETTPADAPLQFCDLADAPLQFSRTQTRYHAPSHCGPSTATGWSQSEDQAPQCDYTVSQNEAEEYPDSQGSDATLQIESDQLLRLQGRRRHGREEIHIIDVHGDDQRSEVEVTRNLTEEQKDMSHSRKKKDMPTRQQKNKHQITYLAYKAKEREFDLKNQWAQNKMTRRQTQAKYGF